MVDKKTLKISEVNKLLSMNRKMKGVCVPLYLSSNVKMFKENILYSVNKGVNFVIISIKYDQAQTENDMKASSNNAGLTTLIQYCKSLNLGIAVKIHVGASEGYGTNIRPTDTALWFKNYKNACLEVADICDKHHISYLGIANELHTMTNENKTEWVSINNTVKSKYPEIKTFISINKIEYASCVIYDVVDIIGFNFYPSLTLHGIKETDINMRKAFVYGLDGFDLIDMVSSLKKKYKKILWLTEVGCAAHSDALQDTFRFDFTGFPGEYDQFTQKFYYEYLFELVWNLGCIDGMSIWSIGASNDPENMFTFENALSSEVVERYWGGETMNESLDLPLDTTMGGTKIHSDANTDLSRYINIREMIRIPARSTVNNNYYKLCRIELKRQDLYMVNRFFVFRHDNTASKGIEYMDVMAKFAVGGSLGAGTRKVELIVTDSKVLSSNNLKYAIMQDDNKAFVIDVYFIHYAGSASYCVQRLIELPNDQKASITFYHEQPTIPRPNETLFNSE